jgi:hypothetical protein
MRGNRLVYQVLGFAVLASALVAVAACGDDDDDDGGDGGGGGATVDVILTEWQVDPAPTTASAGEVTFVADNQGVEDHELVVIKTDLDPSALPTREDGGVDEEGEGIEVIGEIEEFAPGTAEATLNLEAGSYALICNIVEEEDSGEFESHYGEGMYTAFTVE